ncbi:MAG TPA: AAA family ATPase [Trebonia sp.]|nr:AAA family ATPase [Trebonia sp.]
MLTRLEVDGFKNLLDLKVDLGPFTCIAGINGAGKSNVFDSIHFLSLLASRSLLDAAQEVRDVVRGDRLGDPRELFWNGYADGDHRMRLAAEMIVPKDIEDDFGRMASASITYLRYELELGYSPPTGVEKIGRLRLLSETLRHINLSDAPNRLHFPHSVARFRRAVLTGRRSGTAFISTTLVEGQPVVSIHQDGGSRGQPKAAAAARAPATVVSTVTSSDDPTILAARREMQSWRRLALEPSALRTSDRYADPRAMDATGLHMPGALLRIGYQDGDPERVEARVASRLADLSGLRVGELRVDEDDVRELLTVQLTETGGMTLPARSLSEGTLRFLALCVLLEDPSVTGLLCMEEPENGIHPANVEAMVGLVRDLAVDAGEEPGPDNPFRQVIINTHSPHVVQLVDKEDLLFADTASMRAPDGSLASGLLLRPLAGTWRDAPSSEVPAVTKPDILPYLTNPPGTQLSLEPTA